MTRRQKTGIQMADALIEFIHMMYNKNTAIGVLNALIIRLEIRRIEFQEKKEKL